MPARVLIAEDDEAIAMLLRHNLEAEGFEVEIVARGGEAEVAIAENPPDVLVLDWMLPDISGIDFCRKVRAQQVAIFTLTAKGEEGQIEGITASSDDFIAKPFSIIEFTERLKSLLRRANPARLADELAYGDIVLNRSSYVATRNGRALRLSPTEFKLLVFLMARREQVLNRQQILEGVWGRDLPIAGRTVDVHIGRLRKALVRGRQADPIRTVRGVGYAFGAGPPGHNGTRSGGFAFRK